MNIKHNVVEKEFNFRVRFPEGVVTIMVVRSDSRRHARMELERVAREDGFEILPDREKEE